MPELQPQRSGGTMADEANRARNAAQRDEPQETLRKIEETRTAWHERLRRKVGERRVDKSAGGTRLPRAERLQRPPAERVITDFPPLRRANLETMPRGSHEMLDETDLATIRDEATTVRRDESKVQPRSRGGCDSPEKGQSLVSSTRQRRTAPRGNLTSSQACTGPEECISIFNVLQKRLPASPVLSITAQNLTNLKNIFTSALRLDSGVTCTPAHDSKALRRREEPCKDLPKLKPEKVDCRKKPILKSTSVTIDTKCLALLASKSQTRESKRKCDSKKGDEKGQKTMESINFLVKDLTKSVVNCKDSSSPQIYKEPIKNGKNCVLGGISKKSVMDWRNKKSINSTQMPKAAYATTTNRIGKQSPDAVDKIRNCLNRLTFLCDSKVRTSFVRDHRKDHKTLKTSHKENIINAKVPCKEKLQIGAIPCKEDYKAGRVFKESQKLAKTPCQKSGKTDKLPCKVQEKTPFQGDYKETSEASQTVAKTPGKGDSKVCKPPCKVEKKIATACKDVHKVNDKVCKEGQKLMKTPCKDSEIVGKLPCKVEEKNDSKVNVGVAKVGQKLAKPSIGSDRKFDNVSCNDTLSKFKVEVKKVNKDACLEVKKTVGVQSVKDDKLIKTQREEVKKFHEQSCKDKDEKMFSGLKEKIVEIRSESPKKVSDINLKAVNKKISGVCTDKNRPSNYKPSAQIRNKCKQPQVKLNLARTTDVKAATPAKDKSVTKEKSKEKVQVRPKSESPIPVNSRPPSRSIKKTPVQIPKSPSRPDPKKKKTEKKSLDQMAVAEQPEITERTSEKHVSAIEPKKTGLPAGTTFEIPRAKPSCEAVAPCSEFTIEPCRSGVSLVSVYLDCCADWPDREVARDKPDLSEDACICEPLGGIMATLQQRRQEQESKLQACASRRPQLHRRHRRRPVGRLRELACCRSREVVGRCRGCGAECGESVQAELSRSRAKRDQAVLAKLPKRKRRRRKSCSASRGVRATRIFESPRIAAAVQSPSCTCLQNQCYCENLGKDGQ